MIQPGDLVEVDITQYHPTRTCVLRGTAQYVQAVVDGDGGTHGSFETDDGEPLNGTVVRVVGATVVDALARHGWFNANSVRPVTHAKQQKLFGY